MYTVNYVVNQCNNHNIKTFMVKLSSETLDKSIMFDNIDEFFDLAKLSNIKQMYIMPVYDDIENYLISDETITDVLGQYVGKDILECISPKIGEYNSVINKIKIEHPTLIFLSCIYEGQVFITCLDNKNSLITDKLSDPNDALKVILTEKENQLLDIKKKKEDIIKKQQEELKKYILNDKEFYLSTNQHLRYSYTYNLFRNKLGENYAELKAIWCSEYGLATKQAQDFVELLWKEYRKKKK